MKTATRDKFQKMGARLADELHGRRMLPKKYQEWVAETVTRLLRRVDQAAEKRGYGRGCKMGRALAYDEISRRNEP